MSWNPLWAWVCCVLDPQDAIKELLNCVLELSWPLMPIGWFHVLPEIEVKKLGNLRFDQLTPPSKTQFNSSLIASWVSNTEQTQAQSGFQPI